MGSGLNPEQSSCSLTLYSDNDKSNLSDNSMSKSICLKKTPQVYEGHINQETVKGVSFVGPNTEYVASGSDCGNVFIWKKKGGELLRAMEADKYVVNCIASHPHTMVLASSGIDSDVKIWHPEAIEKASLHDISSRPKRHRQMHFSFDLYTEDDEEYDDDEDDDEEGNSNKDESDEEDSTDEYDDDDSGDDEFNYEAYESCDSGESDHDIAIDDDTADGDPPSGE